MTHCPALTLLLLCSSSTVCRRGRRAKSAGADKQTNKHPGMTIRLTLCERDATSHMGTMRHVRRAAIWTLGHK